ncbi:helix-turn-helix domain-containing protein [Rhodococcus sp. APC 3903]|uniref:helix-turn-helix domain-containing protein n=1 Tax=Rhodococcus sp. APC 3903 TaxID=3035193 RepID=UPI0025B42D90|nr:helix-turn-helix domain-containing protein [Rhodococcus sp. APC 3903]MDN3460688.1 helix-turn-helix domain-containing protein [Rhodococcus sp. APC 3903]
MTPGNEDTVSVTAGHTASGNVFRTRLNELFAAGDPNLTNAAVVRGLLEHGCRISKPYLSQLRCGHRSSPSDEVVDALAAFFGVSRGYFFAAPVASGDAHVEDADIIGRLDDPAHKALLLAATGLSTPSLNLLADLATKLRISDHRPVIPADSPSYVRLVESALRSRHSASQPQIGYS